MSRTRAALLVALLVLVGPLTLAACGDDDDSDDATPSADDGEEGDDGDGEDAPDPDLVDTPFCQSLLAIDEIDAGEGSQPPEEVVTSAQQVGALLDEAAANQPGDAPPELATFFADTKATVDAIVASAGDVDAAYTGLAESNPELVARISEEGGYQEAVDFVDDRCGLDIGA